MIRRNENGDLVREGASMFDAGPDGLCIRCGKPESDAVAHPPYRSQLATAAELRAAGIVLVGVEDARALQIGCGSGPYSGEELEAIDAACDRLDAALGEKP